MKEKSKLVNLFRKTINDIYSRGSEMPNRGSVGHLRASANHSRFSIPIFSTKKVNLFSSRAFVKSSAS